RPGPTKVALLTVVSLLNSSRMTFLMPECGKAGGRRSGGAIFLPGGLRTEPEIKALVVGMARENRTCGYDPIVSALDLNHRPPGPEPGPASLLTLVELWGGVGKSPDRGI